MEIPPLSRFPVLLLPVVIFSLLSADARTFTKVSAVSASISGDTITSTMSSAEQDVKGINRREAKSRIIFRVIFITRRIQGKDEFVTVISVKKP